MPYNPQVQDISGQILAQGMRAQSQGIASGIGTGIQNFMKMEEERRKTTGAIQGMLADPYFQQELAKNPTLNAAASKIQSGKANLNDVQQFLGSLTSMQYGRQQQMNEQRLKMEQDTLRMQQENAITNRAYLQGQTDAIRRKQDEAEKLSTAMKDVFGAKRMITELSPDTEGYIEGVMGPEAARAPITRERGLTVEEAIPELLSRGVAITDESVGVLRALGGEQERVRKEALKREELEGRLAKTTSELALAREKLLQDKDRILLNLKLRYDRGELTYDEYNRMANEYVKNQSRRKPTIGEEMAEYAEELRLRGGGQGGSSGTPPPLLRRNPTGQTDPNDPRLRF